MPYAYIHHGANTRPKLRGNCKQHVIQIFLIKFCLFYQG